MTFDDSPQFPESGGKSNSNKVILGVLAVGCSGVVLLGGCLVCGIGGAIWGVTSMPEYATTGAIRSHYANDIKAIEEAIDDEKSLDAKDLELSDDVIEIYVQEESDGPDDDFANTDNESKEPIYKRFNAKTRSHMTFNGAGTGTLVVDGAEQKCLILEVPGKDLPSAKPDTTRKVRYYIYFRDTIGPAEE